jgi:hypothetical protein
MFLMKKGLKKTKCKKECVSKLRQRGHHGGPERPSDMYLASWQSGLMPRGMLMPTAGHQQYPSQHTSVVPQPVPLPHLPHQAHWLTHRSVDAQVVIALPASAGGQHEHDRDAAHRHNLAASSLQSDGAHSPTRLRCDSAQQLGPERHGYPHLPNGEQHSNATRNQQRPSSHHGDSSCSSCPTCGAAWHVQGSPARRAPFNTPRVLDTPQVRRFSHGSSEESKNSSFRATNSLVEQLETATQEDIRERIRTLRLTHSFLARPDASEEDAKDVPILEMKISASEAMLKELQNGVKPSIKPSSQMATKHEVRSAPSGIELQARQLSPPQYNQGVGGADGNGAAGPTGVELTEKKRGEQYALWTKPLESGGESYGQTATQEDIVKDIHERIRILQLTHSLLARPDTSEEDAQAAQILELKISANETMLRKLQDGVETSIKSNGQEGAREQYARTKPWEPPQASSMRGELESPLCDPVDPSTGSSASAALTAETSDDAFSFNDDFNGDNYTTIPETPVQHAPISISSRPPLRPPANKPVYTSSSQTPPVPPRTSLEGSISTASRADLARLRVLQGAPHGRSEYSQAHAHGRPSPSPAKRIPLHDLLQQSRTESPAFSPRLELLPTMSEVLCDRSTPCRVVYGDPEDAPSVRAAPSPWPCPQKSAARSPFLYDVYADPEDAPSVRAAPSPFLKLSPPRHSERDPTLPAGQAAHVEWIPFSTSPQTMNPRLEPDVTVTQSSNTNQLIARFKSQVSANHCAPSPSSWLC